MLDYQIVWIKEMKRVIGCPKTCYKFLHALHNIVYLYMFEYDIYVYIYVHIYISF